MTAAHRVVWTWNNSFAALPEAYSHDEVEKLQVGDLVTMTIIDVFETDNQGKLLSYCPTFDNRAVYKTSPASETIRKSSSKFMTLLAKVQNSKAAKGFMGRAKSVASTMKHRMEEAAANYRGSPQRPPDSDVGSSVTDVQRFEEALNAAESAAVGSTTPPPANATKNDPNQHNHGEQGTKTESETSEDSTKNIRSEHYISDSDDEKKE